MGVLIWLICIGISAILIGYFIKSSNNVSYKSEGFIVSTCPNGTKSYVTSNGETECCNGDIVNNWCNGNIQCTLSPNNSSGIPTCTNYVASVRAQTSANMCPKAIPYYFASLDGSLRGCSVSQSTANGIAPSDPNQLQCILYPTSEMDKVKLDSCYNYNMKADILAKCSTGPSITSSIVSQIKTKVSDISLMAN